MKITKRQLRRIIKEQTQGAGYAPGSHSEKEYDEAISYLKMDLVAEMTKLIDNKAVEFNLDLFEIDVQEAVDEAVQEAMADVKRNWKHGR
jgi:hypothetical protein